MTAGQIDDKNKFQHTYLKVYKQLSGEEYILPHTITHNVLTTLEVEYMKSLAITMIYLYQLLLVDQIAAANQLISHEKVYIESPTDTNFDGISDLIYTEITRAQGSEKLPTIFKMSPYALGGNPVRYHNVNMNLLPQDGFESPPIFSHTLNPHPPALRPVVELTMNAVPRGYASVVAHSLGTGRSTGCPTIGDRSETLAAKAVIDWLNGRAAGYSETGAVVEANWSNGKVGMYGVSYNGTLPNMVATTGVEGLKAIVPIAAISDWYDYYRANGLVVGPGGYVGEDADTLAKYVVRKNTCKNQIDQIAQSMGREHGDYTRFWQERQYASKAQQVKAAVFIIHGQSDWNVRQRHAINWWQSLRGRVPLRMWLHKDGHRNASRTDAQSAIWQWFDFYVKGIDNGVDEKPAVEVQYPSGKWQFQQEWPSEKTQPRTLYLNSNKSLSDQALATQKATFIDRGKHHKIKDLIANPHTNLGDRLTFLSQPLTQEQIISGTPKVSLRLAVTNRRAANITVVIVDYDKNNRGKIITKGWTDPQNHKSFALGELLIKGETNLIRFELEPKQYKVRKGHRIGAVIASTDHEHTLRPNAGTQLEILLGTESSIILGMSN